MSRLSIVIPVYNEEPTVAALLDSVLAAPLPDGIEREIVVVDDGSTDGTRERLARFASDPRVHRAEAVRSEFQPAGQRVSNHRRARLRDARRFHQIFHA